MWILAFDLLNELLPIKIPIPNVNSVGVAVKALHCTVKGCGFEALKLRNMLFAAQHALEDPKRVELQ